jgi:hypothetical protein
MVSLQQRVAGAVATLSTNGWGSPIRPAHGPRESNIEAGPVTAAYRRDVSRTVAVLNEVLATELVCVLRYKRHYYTAQGMHGPAVASEFHEQPRTKTTR